MVNVIATLKPLLHGLINIAGLTSQRVELEPGTVMNIWVPKQTIIINNNSTNTQQKNQTQKWNKPNKPVVVLAHPFCADGILMWFFQALALTSKYSVYVPDFLFFGGSTTNTANRSATFQAECFAKGLRKVGVDKCTLVGLSYGGMVGFKMAELYPDLVEAMVVSSTVIELTESITGECLDRLGFSSWSELLLPETAEGVKLLFSIGIHKFRWLPDFLYRDFLEVIFANRKEKAQLLEALVVSGRDSTTPTYPQRIHFLWANDDMIFNLELAHTMKGRIGEKATLEYIQNAGHLLQLERPFAYNKHVKKILASIHGDGKPKHH
ncbi:putative aminoacrylate hydrolase RutD [Camellia lanceoleosa]|uniref:Aminoacrylate hydrolase RutD n=1 Tax=Camellia lanceoleosa TaxID=1840588 RepID=A0ACC0HMI7_9ERIC|nr:putative aminoacrylate hydrolase RutD [Camellia lanceoleosa]